MRLLRTQTLTVYRQQQATGYTDDDGNWIEPTGAISTFTVQGSRQPFRNGKQQVELPEGVDTNDAFYFYSKTKLLTNDEFLNQRADEMDFDGKRFECFRVEDWTGYGLKTDHYIHLFIRKDKN